MDNKNSTLKVYKIFCLLGYNDTNVLICYIKPQYNAINFNETMMDSIFDTYLLMNIKPKEKVKQGDKIKLSNYEKFNGKKIITCVFTLDTDHPYFFDWINERGEDLILSNYSFIKSVIKRNLIQTYQEKHGLIYMFYKYWINKSSSDIQSPNKIINDIEKKYEDNVSRNRHPPKYIADFFTIIKSDVSRGERKSKGYDVLEEYENKDYFMNELQEMLIKSVNNFFEESK